MTAPASGGPGQAPGDPAIEEGILTEERNAALRAAFAELPPSGSSCCRC